MKARITQKIDNIELVVELEDCSVEDVKQVFDEMTRDKEDRSDSIEDMLKGLNKKPQTPNVWPNIHRENPMWPNNDIIYGDGGFDPFPNRVYASQQQK